MSERPTFSPFWHRVRVMKPRLRPHVQITRQHYRGRRWHVAHDPSSNQFYRLNPIAHEMVSLLDGRRTVEEVWKHVLGRHGDAAPTQGEVLQLLSQLYNANLLSADTTPETEQLLRRGRERLKKKAAQQAIGIMYFRVRLFNPDAIFGWIEPLLRPLLNRVGFVLWMIWVGIGFAAVLPHMDTLISGVDSVIAPSNWAWLIVVFIITKAIHETGHGVICKRFGGQVPEFGMMLLVLFPAPFVDASACWAFPSKWQRMAVGAGGMIFELAIASAAAMAWVATQNASHTLIHQLAYNAMFIASVSTVVFNANPLMRFDGYYILSDLLEIPNLMSRSMNMIKYLFQKYMYRVRQATPPSQSRAEQTVLIIYGLAALAYRVFLFITITLYVMGKLFAIGLILAIWTAAAWFIMPVGKFVHWLATNSQLSEFRPRAVATSIVAIGVGVLAIGALPMPDNRRGSGVIESDQRTGVHFAVDGFVERVSVRAGDLVQAGDVLIECTSDELQSQLRMARAQLREAEGIERAAIAQNPAAARIAAERVRTQHDVIGVLEDRIESLTVRAPHDGMIVGSLSRPETRDPHNLVGRYVTRGQLAFELVDTQSVHVAAAMTQAEAGWINELTPEQYGVEMRRFARVEEFISARVERVSESGRKRLPHAALGYVGGGQFETQSDDQSGLLAKAPQFTIYLVATEDDDTERSTPIGLPGERVSIRFSLPDKPLLSQWVDRLHKLIQGRVDL